MVQPPTVAIDFNKAIGFLLGDSQLEKKAEIRKYYDYWLYFEQAWAKMALFTEISNDKNFAIRLIDVDETLVLRKMILRPDLNLSKARAPYAGPEKSFHVGGFLEDRLISIASFIEKPNQIWQEDRQWMLRGMATHPNCRNLGYGHLVIMFGMREALKYKPRLIWCSARVQAVSFYKRASFMPVGKVVEHIKTGPHQLLCRRFVPVYAK